MNYNRIILAGHLTRDVEIRHSASNTPIGNFALAVNRKTPNGDETCFVDCTAFGKTAEVMAQHLRKGRNVMIEGRLALDQWEDQQGNKRSKHKVIVDTFQFVGAPPEGKPAQRSEPEPVLPDDDIPF